MSGAQYNLNAEQGAGQVVRLNSSMKGLEGNRAFHNVKDNELKNELAAAINESTRLS